MGDLSGVSCDFAVIDSLMEVWWYLVGRDEILCSYIGAFGGVLLSELEFYIIITLDYQGKTSNPVGGKDQTHLRNCISFVR